MTDFLTDYGVVFALGCAGAAVVYGLLITQRLLAKPPGNDRMVEISGAIQEGASAYLKRQYTIIAGVGVVIAVLLIPLQNVETAIGFVIGGILSGAAGFIGMNLSVRANSRVAEAARGGIPPALDVAFKGGSVTGLLVVGLALLGVAGYYGVLVLLDFSDKEAVDALIGLGFGGSLISVFARLGGGIFTKAADVGADLVGKIEAGIPEDDPRNPAVIADNVGDNVGDCAGMAADLFETYAVTAVAVMLLGVLTFTGEYAREVAIYPLALGGVAIIASIVGALSVRTRTGNVERALYIGLVVSALLSAAAFYPITDWLMSDPVRLGLADAGADAVSVGDLWLCGLIGVGVTALLFVITDFYTSTRFRPVRTIAEASETGHATNIIQGLAQGFQSTAAPVLVLVLAILGANELAGIYGIGIAVMAQLSLTGLIVALDAFGPITDNAGGIAEMAELPQEVRDITDPLDAVGNTTKAVTKGYAIGSAALAALVLFNAFLFELQEEDPEKALSFDIAEPDVLIGLLIGGIMVYLFSALSIEAVGRAGGQVVEEVRRQFREKPGIMKGTEKPDYAGSVAIVTASAQREMILPSLIPIVVPVVVGPAQLSGARRPPDRRHRRRHLRRDLDDRRRRRLGQRQEADRGRLLRWQGIRCARRLGDRRHGRRPLQGHSRPGDQPDDQGRQHRRDPDHPDRRAVATKTPLDTRAAGGSLGRAYLLCALARRIPRDESLSRVHGTGALFSAAYGNVGSSIYYALGVVALYALGLTPVTFMIAGLIFVFTAATYTEATVMYPEAGGSSSFARHAFNELVSFFAAWGQMLTYIITIAISAFFVPHYLAVFWEPLGEGPGDVIGGDRPDRRARGPERQGNAGVGPAQPGAGDRGPGDPGRAGGDRDRARALSPTPSSPRWSWGSAPTWGDFLLGIAVGMIAYTGIETISNMAEEAKDASTDDPARGRAGGARGDRALCAAADHRPVGDAGRRRTRRGVHDRAGHDLRRRPGAGDRREPRARGRD